ncbi:MAG TPA: SRPBCC domain-containing protein [Chitinophagaceae bacterium]
MKGEPLVVEYTYDAPAASIWQAITDKTKMKQWYFDIPEFKAEPGSRFQFHAGNEGKEYLHLCEVKEVIPGKKLSYSWKYKDQPGDSLVSFELFPEGDKTRVKLLHTGLESFPDQPDFRKSSFQEGWTYILGTSLKKFVEKVGAGA